MNFNKEKFSEILVKIKDSYGSINQMADKTGITSAYISKLIRLMYNNAPSPEILKKIADNSNGIISYSQLMEVCGYIDTSIDIKNEILKKQIEFIVSKSDELKQYGLTENQILTLQNIVCLDISSEEYYNSLENFLKTLDTSSALIILKTLQKMLKYIQNFSNEQIELSRNLQLEANKLIENATNFEELHKIEKAFSKHSNKFYPCPVYGRISAGQPNWAEECIEGRLPIDPELMNIVNPEECFFLKVNGESMNRLVKNGAFALIRKTDFVNDGEVAVVLVNGYDATLKKFSKQGDLVVLEPMSSDPSFTTQVYNKDTDIKIIGKYIGKMEMK